MKLIYGKANIPGIVNIEVKDDVATLHIQDNEGNISTKEVSNRFWVLTPEKIDGAVKLDGDLWYKWGKQVRTKKEFYQLTKVHQDHYTIYNAVEALMVKDGYCYFQGLQPRDVSLISFDIETTTLNPNDVGALILLISAVYRDKNQYKKKLFAWDEYDSQKDMLLDFVNFVNEMNPSLVIGHNEIQFDLMYINGIAEKFGIKLNLGRDDSALYFSQKESKFRFDGSRDLHYKKAKIWGREIVDTYFLAIKFDVLRTMESYGLKPLIKQLGLEKPGRTFYDASQIRYKYTDPVEWEKIKSYCMDDADDAISLWDKMGPLFFHMAPMIPKSFSEIILSASGSQLNGLMVRAYLQDRHSIPKAEVINSFEGAISWGRPGIYKNVWKVDCAAMYPSIIIGYRVYDETKDPKAYLLELTRHFKTKRLEYKKLAADTGLDHYRDMDNAAKSILNSFYGFCGTSGLNFNSYKCADFITRKGREILNEAVKWATGKTFEENAPDYGKDAEEVEE